MDLQKIKSLIDFASASDLADLELEENGCRLRLSRDRQSPGHAGSAPTPVKTAAAVAEPSLKKAVSPPDTPHAGGPIHVVKAPMFGMFSRSPAPDEAPFVQLGDAIRVGQKLGLLEAMKIFNAVESDRDGTIVAILAEDGQEVEAGQALFHIEQALTGERAGHAPA